MLKRRIPSFFRPTNLFTAMAVSLVLSAQMSLAQKADPASPKPTPTPAVDDGNTTTLPEVDVNETAWRTEEDILNDPQTVTVLDQSTINRNQEQTPNEMLKGQPGIWSVNVAAQGSPIMRGQIGNGILYLWDGIRINNGALFAGPNGFFNQFPIGAIDRMEVVHGSGSVEYGSDAIGGVINIIPKKGEFTDQLTIGGDVSARYGSNDNEDTQIYNLHISDQKFSLAAGLTYQDVGNYYGPNVGDLNHTGFESLGGYADAACKIADNQTIRLSWFQNNRNDVGYYTQSLLNANGIPRITDPYEQRGIVKLDYTLTDLGFLSSELKFYAYFQYYNGQRYKNVDNPPTYTETATNTDQYVSGLGAQNTTNIKKLQLVYGLDYRDENLFSILDQSRLNMISGSSGTVTPAGSTPDGLYQVFDAFLEAQYPLLDNLKLSAGVRFENTHIDSHPTELDVIPNAGYTINSLMLDKSWQSVTWDAGAIYNITKSLDLVANISTAFRTPTYSDLFSAGTPVYSSKTASVPNPDLAPERSITYETGPRYHTDNFNSSLTAYWMALQDVVTSATTGLVTIPGQGTYIATQNTNSGSGYVAGVELAAVYKPYPGWTTYGNATYTYGEDTTNNVPLRFIPPLNGLIGIRYESPSGRWWAEVEEVLVATFDRPAPGDELDSGFSQNPAYGSPNTTNNLPYRPNYHIPGYALTNLRGGFQVWKKEGRSLDITLNINNLLNASYREVYAQQELVAPGFGIVVGSRLIF